MEESVLYIGSEIKPYIELEPVGSLNMDDYDFQAEFFCYSNRRVTVSKSEMKRMNENRYCACLDTRALGTGTLKCLVTRYIPDGDFDDGLRTDVRMFVFDTPIVGV